jgi:hypothetical protein
MQTDDTLILANRELANKEDAELTFASKPRQELTPTDPIQFNGVVIQLITTDRSLTDRSLAISQQRQISRIELAKDADDYVTQRARGAYIVTVFQPERAFGFSSAAGD